MFLLIKHTMDSYDEYFIILWTGFMIFMEIDMLMFRCGRLIIEIYKM